MKDDISSGKKLVEWRDRRLDKLFGQEDILQKCIDEHDGRGKAIDKISSGETFLPKIGWEGWLEIARHG